MATRRPEPTDSGARSPSLEALLARAAAGDGDALRQLFDELYDDLRTLAHRHARRSGGGDAAAGPSATSLVHEVFLRVARRGQLAASDRAHFFAIVSRAMRQVVIDRARGRLADRRGGGAVLEPLGADTPLPAGTASIEEVLAIDAALERLALEAPRMGRIVEWHFFGGLTFHEIAEALDVSERTVHLDWRAARALLHHQLGGTGA